MKIVGNLLWLVCGGFVAAIAYFTSSLILAVTIIGIPFAVQTFKIGIMTLWPFGSEVVTDSKNDDFLALFMNIFWLFIGGFWIAILHVISGILLAITIIGLPFANQHFKLARLSLFPFGKRIMDK